MPRQVATVVENSFVKGLVTEATGLTYPANSVVDTDNCVFDVLGRLQRRQGLDYEYGHAVNTVSKVGAAINLYQWKNATGDGLTSFQVVQIGSTLYFYFSSDGSTSLSAGVAAGTINLLTYQAAGSPSVLQYECQFTDGQAKLFVVHPCLENFYITYSAGSFTVNQYTLYQRDFEGVPDGLPVDTRPGTLSIYHRYNLYNQGWTADKVEIIWFGNAPTAGTYPSNADIWWTYKNLSDQFDVTTTANFSPGNTPASQGHYVLPVYNQDRNAVSGLSGLPVVTSNAARTSAVSWFAGRVFYSGIASAGYVSKIYFSRILTKDSQVGQCYQDADPSAEDVFALQPDDGGVISIPDAGTIYRMVPAQNNLIVFAYRGVWLISGSTGLGFTATDFVVSKLSTVRTSSSTSFVDGNGLPLWWNSDGIWGIQATKDGSGLVVAPVSRNVIQTFYDDIPTVSKAYSRGTFNPLTQVISWLYRSTPGGTLEEQYEFDRVLNYNLLTGAFYPWTISEGVTIHGITNIDGSGGTIVEQTIIDNAVETVITDTGDIVIGYSLDNISVSTRTKFFVSVPHGSNVDVTFAEENDPSFADWATTGSGTTFESYAITGYKLQGTGNKQFQNNLIDIYNEGTGTFYFQGVWDFSTTANNGRYSVRQILDYSDQNVSVGRKRPKVRGTGRTLQFKVTSRSGNNFNIIGWSAWETTNSTP